MEFAAIFEPPPLKWGLRGDPHVWNQMRILAAEASVANADEAVRWLHGAFRSIVGVDLETTIEAHVHRPALDHGGMSGGMVDLAAWRATLMPLLEQRAHSVVYR